MTSQPNRTSPNTFARYIENLRTRATVFAEFLLTREARPEVMEFPCTACAGEGLLIKESRYRKLRGGDFFKKTGGLEIRSTEMIICPCCQGDGVNQLAVDEYAINSLNQKAKEVA